MTDIPSIVSRSTLMYFDPNVKYLPNRIRNRQQPGIRVNFEKINSKYLQYCSDQFKPYENVFGCNIFESEFDYQGTLIRLPLRTEPSAISSNLYSSKSEMEKLFEIMLKNADSMLLFTQSVNTVECYVLEDDAEDGNEMKLVFKFGKSPVDYYVRHEIDLSPIVKDEFSWQSSLLKAATAVIKNPKK
jgi:hypothetical protein